MNSENFDEGPSPSWLFGIITMIQKAKAFGYIRPDCKLPNGLGQRGVHFFLNKANTRVQEGDRVMFILSEIRTDSPSAQQVRRVEEDSVERQTAREDRRRPRSEVRQRSASTHRSVTRLSVLDAKWGLSGANMAQGRRASSDSRSDVGEYRSIPSCSGDLNAMVSANHQHGIPQPHAQQTTNDRRRFNYQKKGFMSEFRQRRGTIVEVSDSSAVIMPKTNARYSGNHDRTLYNATLAVFSSGHLPIEIGDEVTFTRGQVKRDLAVNPTLVKCSRTVEKLEYYLGDLLRRVYEMSDSRSRNYVVSAVTCQPVWDCIGRCEDLSNDAIAMLNSILLGLDERFTLKENVTSVLETLLKTPLFVERNSRYSRYIQDVLEQNRDDKVDDVYKVMLMMAKQVPAKIKCIVRSLESLVTTETTSFLCTGIISFLYKMLKQGVKSPEGDIEDLEWDDLPLVPTVNELLKGSLESESQLRSVNETGPYPSVHDYIDTYFRLLRSDCFSALSKGARELLNGTLDKRDMNVYTKVTMIGFQITDYGSGMAIGLSFTPIRQVSNWDQSSCLMYGNLLCISVSGTFRDPIWATVVNRELLQSHKIVVVELCSEGNSLSDSEAILSLYLSSTRAIMIESPTYYKAYQPVLKSLQSTDPEQLPFQEELVHAATGISSHLMDMQCTFDASIIYRCPSGKHRNVDAFCENIVYDEDLLGTSILDASQENAVRQCLSQRIGIVQGPPGTGKTFIGIKLVQILLSLSNPPTTPILVLTYKNHSLDEFLKEIVQIYPDRVARVGGRSQDETLAKCNLKELRRNYKMTREIYSQVLEFKAEIKKLQTAINMTFKKLNASRSFKPDALVDLLSEDQLKEFLLTCPWKRCGKVSLKSIHSADGWTEVSTRVSSNDVSEVLNACGNTPIAEILATQKYENGSLGHSLYRLVQAALRHWQPPLTVFQSLNSAFASPEINPIIAGADPEAIRLEPNRAKSEIEVDEKDAEAIQKERIAAFGHHIKRTEELLNEMIFFDDRKKENSEWISLMESAKEISQQLSPAMMLGIKNIWDLNEFDRAKLIQCLLYKQYQEAGERFQELLTIQQKMILSKEELESQHKAAILQSKKVVGMTITGANINQQLIAQIKPEIILVEEAAEVLEPQILALLGNWTKHLLLIGDHKQLRPSVENYKLCKDYHFDLSMMERLINNNLPFASLTLQNRMRPEFANLLLDIYPNLKSNLSRVERNAPANCIGTSLFFWNHCDPETSERSFINEREADRAIRLAIFLIQQGYKPEQITILSPYLGQVRILRRKMKKEEETFPDLFPKSQSTSEEDDKPAENKSVQIHTVDMYQGDENDFVIVSLVRSNEAGKIGFVGVLNRRCVAQSRSRCGLYFIGNRDTLAKNPIWCDLLKKLEDLNCLGDKFPCQCPLHPGSKVNATTSDEIPVSVTFCKIFCSMWMICEVHRCVKPCQPRHTHSYCSEIVTFTFESCGHACSKKCSESEDDKKCEMEVVFEIEECNHMRSCLCHQKERVTCDKPCEKSIPSCGHPCQLLCGVDCSSKPCSHCKQIAEEKEKAQAVARELFKKEQIQRIDEEIEQILRNPIKLCRIDLSKDGDSAAEYFGIEDKVIKYIQPEHNWFPQVTKVEKVTNLDLEVKWLKVRKGLIDPTHVEQKFHGTSADCVEEIIKNGFKLSGRKDQMFGNGIYFASDSSKSAQSMYTKDSKMLLVCDVLLGKTMTVENGRPTMTYAKLQRKGYDSLFAKRGTKDTGGVFNDEFVVYNPDQAIPRYIVHYEETDYRSEQLNEHGLKPNVSSNGQALFTKFSISPSRTIKEVDPQQMHFRIAESQFLRLRQRIGRGCSQVTSVDYYINPPLEDKFNRMLNQMAVKYPGLEESNYILAFHGTKVENIDSIVETNFDISRLASNTGNKGLYGAGIYFSEFPDVSQGYAGCGKLLLCKVLPGKTYICTQTMTGASLQQGFDSHGCGPDKDGRCHELVIFDADQILPCYVISFTL